LQRPGPKKEADIQSLEGELNTLLQLASRLETEQGDVRTNIVALEKKKEHLKGEMLRLKGETADLEEEAQLEEERLKTRKRLLGEIRENFEKARANMSAGETREVGLNHETGYLNRALEQISDTRSRLENELAETVARSESILRTSERKTGVRRGVLWKNFRIWKTASKQRAKKPVNWSVSKNVLRRRPKQRNRS
jgi:chromosome segregation ATPase